MAASGLTADAATAMALAGAGPENTTLPNALPGFMHGGLIGYESDKGKMRIPHNPDEPVAYARGGVESGNQRFAAALEMNAADLADMRFDPMGVAHPGLVTPSKVAGVSRTEQQVLALAGAVSGGPRDAPQAGIILP
tara:strand:+ start:1277 stop:1687 length:411 start_codon:yes stop_codon:yes gene_type:complete